MHKPLCKGNILPLLGIIALIIGLVALPVSAKGGSARTNSVTASLTAENWTSGITVEGVPTYNAVVGRLVSNVAVFRSARTEKAATIFPAPASEKTIEAANVYILSRSGTYTGTVTLSLAVYDFSGTLQHKVNSVDIDLQSSPTGAWIPLTLSSTEADLSVAPGEFLAFCYSLSDVTGGNLDIRPLFDVSLQ